MSSGFRALLLISLSVSAAAAPPPSPNEVRQLVAEVKYDEAKRLLEKLQAIEGQTLETTLELLELQGIIAGALKQPAAARAAFRKLVSLKPNAQLSANYAPRITTPFYEAKGWVSSHAPVRFERRAPTIRAGSIEEVGVTLKNDSLSLAKKVRIFTRAADQTVQSIDQPASAAVSQAVAPASDVSWWAQLLGDRDAVIAQVGSAQAPILDSARVDAPTDVNSLITTPAPSKAVRIGGTVSAGLGVAAIAIGAIFGIGSSQARASFDKATEGTSLVTSITRSQALQLDFDARSKAMLANIFFVTGAALLVTGVVLWLVGAAP